MNVTDVHGRFMSKHTQCHICGQFYKIHEEKQTDVNIGLHVICDGMNDLYDNAIIISGDTDLIPVIDAAHKNMPDKEIGVIFPLRRFHSSLEKVADFSMTMTENLLKQSQFP